MKLPAVLTIPPTKAISTFIGLCGSVGVATPLNELYDAAVKTREAYRSGQPTPPQVIALQERWYDSIERGEPDYGVYADDFYFAELWACWVVYSRHYIRALAGARALWDRGSIIAALNPAERVVDLGCGCGYTTAALVGLFPEAAVVGTNLDGTRQTAIARRLSEGMGFSVVEQAEGKADVVFASEYFEHFPAPVEHLRSVLDDLDPTALLVANAFSAESIGHFNRGFTDGADVCDPREISKRFYAELRQRGYEKQKTRLWNQRPQYWIRP